MRGTKRIVAMAQRFWQQAERDVELAPLLVQPRGYYLAAYLAHQAAEKALKAACWHLRGEEPPWKHALRSTADLLVLSPDNIPDSIQTAISLLNPILERSRYPSGNVEDPIPADSVGEEEARVALQAAGEIMKWVKQLLQERPCSRRPRTS